jgi:catechol 2,3-dioxygenase-like lactoylglutathione lyase family enzyme
MTEDTSTDGAAERVALNHVGHTVPDIEAAVEWYRDVLGLSVTLAPKTITADGSDLAGRFEAIVGEFEQVRMAHLRDRDGHGFELFEYTSVTDSETAWDRRAEENWPHRPGINHLAVTVEDVDALARRVEDNGGARYTDVWEINPDIGHEVAYLTDPWDNVIEASSHSFDHFSK